MDNPSILYDLPSLVITAALFATIMLCNELGFHIGRFVQDRTDEEVKALTGAIQGSVLGLLALLLGFTFSMSMQRYDNRSEALIAEANAIGTMQLRVALMPEQYRAEAAERLASYVDLRIAAGAIDLTRRAERRDYAAEISAAQADLWALVVEAVEADPRPGTTGVIVSALNDLIDAQGKRSALLEMHVPDIVLYLLFLVFVAAGGMLGYSSGLSGRRVVAPTLMVSFLIALIVFIIIDLDRPRRGVIQVNQEPLLMLAEPGVAAASAAR